MTNKLMRNKIKKAFVCTLSAAVMMSTAAVPVFADEEVVVSTEDTEADAEDAAEVETAEAETDLGEETETEAAGAEETAAFDDGTSEAVKDTQASTKYTVSYTAPDGKVTDNVQDTGVSIRVQDVPASQNAGTLKLNGFDGKVAWLLSQYDTGKPSYEWDDSMKSNIWPTLDEGGLCVSGPGEATIVAWDASTLSQDVH